MIRLLTAERVRSALIRRQELALVDLRDEAQFATGHPLFAAQIPLARIEEEAPVRVPRRDVTVVLYDDGEGLVEPAAGLLRRLGYSNVYGLADGLSGWRAAGLEIFQDVNSYGKAFGELVESRRHTPSLSANEVHALLEAHADIAIVDARRADEYATMTIPSSTSVPGAELVLRAGAIAPRPATTIIVHCAGRTRSILGAQSLLNAGVPNRVVALRNGTMGWTLEGKPLHHAQDRRAPEVVPAAVAEARSRSREVAYRAGVRRIGPTDLADLRADRGRTLYQFDVRTPEEYERAHLPGFAGVPGGQLVQETDMVAPVRGARIVLSDDVGPRADMTASWLAQMAWEVYVLDGGFEGPLEDGVPKGPSPRGETGRYRRPYEGVGNEAAAMRAYLEWEGGLVAQLRRDATHGFFVL